MVSLFPAPVACDGAQPPGRGPGAGPRKPLPTTAAEVARSCLSPQHLRRDPLGHALSNYSDLRSSMGVYPDSSTEVYLDFALVVVFAARVVPIHDRPPG